MVNILMIILYLVLGVLGIVFVAVIGPLLFLIATLVALIVEVDKDLTNEYKTTSKKEN